MTTSCIILNYNVPDLVSDLAVRLSEYKSIDNVIIVDNCSTDDSEERLLKIAGGHVHFIKSERNGGYGYGNNFGMKYAKEQFNSDLFLIVGPDVEVSERCITAMETSLSDDDKCVMVSACAYYSDGQPQKSAWKISNAFKFVVDLGYIINQFDIMGYKEEHFKGKDVCTVDCVMGSLMLIKSDQMLQYGMYDEEIFLFCEETTLGIKFKKAGFTTKLLLNESYIHHHSVSIKKAFSSKLVQLKMIRDSYLIVLKNQYKISRLGLFFARTFLKFTLVEARIKEFFIPTK